MNRTWVHSPGGAAGGQTNASVATAHTSGRCPGEPGKASGEWQRLRGVLKEEEEFVQREGKKGEKGMEGPPLVLVNKV